MCENRRLQKARVSRNIESVRDATAAAIKFNESLMTIARRAGQRASQTETQLPNTHRDHIAVVTTVVIIIATITSIAIAIITTVAIIIIIRKRRDNEDR